MVTEELVRSFNKKIATGENIASQKEIWKLNMDNTSFPGRVKPQALM